MDRLLCELRKQQAHHMTPGGKHAALRIHAVFASKIAHQMGRNEIAQLMQHRKIVFGRFWFFHQADSLVGIRRRPPFFNSSQFPLWDDCYRNRIFSNEPSPQTAPLRPAMNPPNSIHLFLAALLGGVAGACAETGFDDWRAAAEERILEHRTSEVTLQLELPGGQPLPAGTPVRVQMRKSAFNWGVATGAGSLGSWHQEGHPNFLYYEDLPRLADSTQATSAQQWAMTRQSQWQKLEQAFIAYAQMNGLSIRGHNMFWGHWMEDFVVPEPYHTWFVDEVPGKQDEFREGVETHIRWVGERMPFIYEWDVVNEPISKGAAFRYLGAEALSDRAELIAEWLNLARESAPQANLVINEFGILHPEDDKPEKYLELCRLILEAGGALDGVGFQLHQWRGKVRQHPQEIYDQLDEYAKLGLSLSVTEYDTYGGGWDTVMPWDDFAREPDADEIKGQWFEDILVMFYSHPAATTFQTWIKWDGVSDEYAPKGVFYRKDWSKKPQLEAWEKRVLGEWRTDEGLTANAAGEVSLRAHHGDYRVSAELNGEIFRATVPIGPDTARETVVLSNDTKPAIRVAKLRSALVDVPYYAAVPVAGGETPITWTLTEGPDWLTMRDDGVLAGTAPALGQHEVAVRVVDADGDADEARWSLSVVDVPPVHAAK